MILGTGIDLIDIRRIEHSLARFGERFEKRVFTPAEQNYARKGKVDTRAIASIYAKRFAAKEACAKALGTGFGQNVSWQDIEVIKNDSGGVGINLSGAALKKLTALTPESMKPQIFLSLTDEYPYAQAQVMISCYFENSDKK